MNNETPRHTIVEKPYGGYFVQDTKTEQRVVDCTNVAEAQDCAAALDRLAALNIRPGDTVTGWDTSTSPRRITVTVDREPWPHGMRNLIVSDGRSVEALRVDGLTVVRSGPEPVASCWQCEDVWPADELQPDGNGDAICSDCASTNAGVAEADYMAYRAYAMGR